LTGVIIHVGKSATSGHYTAFVKQPGASQKWYYMDDCHSETVSENTVLKQRDAYVLFYTRKEVKLELPSVESPDNSRNASSVAIKSPTSDSAALKHANKANFGSSESKTVSSNISPATKGNLSGVRRSLNYVSRERSNKAKSSKKRRSWNPPETVKLDSANDQTLLLGGINIGNWSGNDYSPPKDSLRSTASKKMEHKVKSRKKKMRSEFWDSHIDEVKKPKKKTL